MTREAVRQLSEPTRPTGYMDHSALLGDIDGYGAVVDYLLDDLQPDLMWPMSIRTYARMRHEPQLTAVLSCYSLAIRRARWSVDPAGCQDRVVAQIADDLGLGVKDTDDKPTGARRRNFTMAEHVRLALLSLPYGHMPFEQSWAQENGQWRLAAVQERMPQTITEVHLNEDGTLGWVKQESAAGGGTPKPISTANRALVWYVNEREGSNYFGRSILRPAYPLWLIKDQVLRVHATSIRRFGLGIPDYEAPPNATPGQIAEAQRTLGNFKASEHAANVSPNGFKLRLAGMSGSVPDAVAFLTYLDMMMARYTLTSLLNMAQAERGNRSLGETMMDLMVYSQQAVANGIAEAATAQLVVPLVDANFGEDEPAPRICVEDVGADLELTAQDVYWLGAYWGNLPEALQRYVLERYGISADDLTSAVPTPPQNLATTGGAAHA